jgi:hypothetical protein
VGSGRGDRGEDETAIEGGGVGMDVGTLEGKMRSELGNDHSFFTPAEKDLLRS